MTQQDLVLVSPEVREVLTDPVADRLQVEGQGEFNCVSCKLPGSTEQGDAVSVVVFQHPDQMVIKLAHQLCVGSVVIPTDKLYSQLPGVLEPEADDVTTVAGMTEIPGQGKIATLVFDRERGVSAFSEAGDSIDPWFSALLKSGWSLAPAAISWPRPVPRWKLALDRKQGIGEIFAADKSSFLDQLPPLPPGWTELAARNKEILIVAGSGLGLAANEGMGSAVRRSLDEAAQQGNLLAGRIAVSLVAMPPAPRRTKQQTVRSELASELRTALEQRARPGQANAGGLNDTTELAPLPARPKLHLTAYGDFPILLVDLAAPAEAQEVTDTLIARMLDEGMKPFMGWDQGPVALPPEGWGYVLWPSQVVIMAGKGSDDMPRKLLFEPFRPIGSWYESVKKSPNSSLGLMVGNMNLPDPEQDQQRFQEAIEERMAAGDVLACALMGMCTE